MQGNTIKGTERKEFREYLRDNLSARDYDNLHLILNTTKHRITKMLNYVESHPWQFDQLVTLFRKTDIEILPSVFIKDYGLVTEISEIQIEALDALFYD